MRGRPNLYTSYEAESQLMPTRTKKVILGLFLVVAVLMPFDLPIIDQLPLFASWVTTCGCASSIGRSASRSLHSG